jgi:hypothetical protein
VVNSVVDLEALALTPSYLHTSQQSCSSSFRGSWFHFPFFDLDDIWCNTLSQVS